MHCTIISAEFEFGGYNPLGAHPQKCGYGLWRWENQRRLSSFEIIYFTYNHGMTSYIYGDKMWKSNFLTFLRTISHQTFPWTICRSAKYIVKNGGSDPDSVWHHRSDGSRDETGIVGFGDRSTGRGTFGGEFAAHHCNQRGLCGVCVPQRRDAALFPNYFGQTCLMRLKTFRSYTLRLIYSDHYIPNFIIFGRLCRRCVFVSFTM